MIIDNVMYHNVDGIIKRPYGMRLLRYSEGVTENLEYGVKKMSGYACNAEMRFVTEAPETFVSLMSEIGEAHVTVYYGDCVLEEFILQEGVITRIELYIPKVLDGLDESFYKNNLFSKNVWRLHFKGMITVCGIDSLGYPIRPPKKEEMPEKTILCYGSSISQGIGSVYYPITYVNVLANLLGMDCLAKGLAGACFCNTKIAQSFAERNDWDCAFLELGINMIWAPDKFLKRFEYFADTMYKTGKKLVFTTIFDNNRYYEDGDAKNTCMEFDAMIRKKCNEFDKERVLLIDGRDIVCESGILTADGTHPSTEGHMKMGYNIYEKVKDFLV